MSEYSISKIKEKDDIYEIKSNNGWWIKLDIKDNNNIKLKSNNHNWKLVDSETIIIIFKTLKINIDKLPSSLKNILKSDVSSSSSSYSDDDNDSDSSNDN